MLQGLWVSMVGLLGVATLATLGFWVPARQKMFDDMHIMLPAPTQLLIGFTRSLHSWIPFFPWSGAAILAALLASFALMGKEAPRLVAWACWGLSALMFLFLAGAFIALDMPMWALPRTGN